MKRLLTFLIILFMCSYVYGQFKAGIIGGLNIASFDAENTEISSRILWGTGLLFNYDLGSNFSLQAEPMFIVKGGVQEQDQEKNQPKLTLEQNFIELPLLLKYEYGEQSKVFLLAGPSLGIVLTSEMDADVEGITFKADLDEVTESLDLGLCFGGGFSTEIYPGEIFLEVKYSLGLTNLAKDGKFIAKAGPLKIESDFDSEESKYHSRGFHLMVGYSIPL